MNGVNNLIFGLLLGIALGGGAVYFAMRGRNNEGVLAELRSQLDKANAQVAQESSIKNKLEEMQEAVKKLSAEASDADRRDRKSTRLNSSHIPLSRMPSSA